MELSDAEVAVAAAQAGAEVIRARYGTRLARFDKGQGDFATDADIESERVILGVLHAQRPADAVLGEELGLSGSATADRTWLVDPLCGTLNFAAQTPLVAVNVTLRSAGRLTAACSAHPV
ncbi:MAG TPA: inositol monophosphatase family protein, partial [Streptosporangiaceae bacterium]